MYILMLWTKEDTDILLKAVLEQGCTSVVKWSKIKKDYPQLAKYNAPGALRGRYLTYSAKCVRANGVTCKCGKVLNKPWVQLQCNCNTTLQQLVEYISKNFKNIVWILDGKVYKDIPEIVNSDLRFIQSKNYQLIKDIFETKAKMIHPKSGCEPNESFCMVSDNDCNCTVKCVYRLLFNNLKGNAIYNGLPESIVKTEYLKYTCNSVKNSWNSTPELTIDWFNKVISRNKKLKENSIISYRYTVKKIFENNLETIMWNPKYLLTLNFNFELIGPFKNIIWYISDTELYKLYGLKSLAMRQEYSRVLGIERKNKLKNVQKRSLKDNSNWCSLADIKDMVTKMEKEYNTMHDFQKVIWFKMQIYMHCLRNEYSTLKVSGYDIYKDNYIENKMIVLNNYKTVKTHGRIEIQIPDILKDIFDLYHYRIKKGHAYLFMTQQNQPFKKSEFSRFIINASILHLGKRIGSRLLRKITITEALKDEVPLSNKMELASKMLHTPSTQQTYRKM